MDEELDEQQTTALNEMRAEYLERDGFGMDMDDKTFIRYLRARYWNFKKAKKMLDKTLKWRHDFGLAEMHTHADDNWNGTIKFENTTGKMYVRGYDKFGHAIIYMYPRNENSNNLLGNIKHLIYTIERAISCMKANASKREKVVVIFDFDGFLMSKAPPLNYAMKALQILLDHYPERLHKMYILRPQYMFYLLYRYTSLNPLIDSITRGKIVLVTQGDLNQERNALFDDVDRDYLESYTGGNDHRAFDSGEYLEGDFSKDFLMVSTSVGVYICTYIYMLV